MNSENPFWAAMLSNPEDALPRLVFADCLEENGETERGQQLRYIHGFSGVGFGGFGDGGFGDGGDGDGGDGGFGGFGGGDGGGGFGDYKLLYGVFVMENGFYLLYFPTGYYPLVQVGYVEIKGAELLMYGRRVVARSGIGADWEGLAYKGPDTATLHSAAKNPVAIPRQCVGHMLNMEKWAKALPEAVEYATRLVETQTQHRHGE